MDLTLEELFELAGTVSDALGIEFGLKRTDSGWYAQFIGISKRDNIFTTKSGPHSAVNKALIAGLKAVRPKQCMAGVKLPAKVVSIPV